jgi:hypothetical protein
VSISGHVVLKMAMKRMKKKNAKNLRLGINLNVLPNSSGSSETNSVERVDIANYHKV